MPEVNVIIGNKEMEKAMRTLKSSILRVTLLLPGIVWAHPGNHGASFMHDAALPDLGQAGLALIVALGVVSVGRRMYAAYRQRNEALATAQADERHHD